MLEKVLVKDDTGSAHVCMQVHVRGRVRQSVARFTIDGGEK
jgi:hypothetical protein